MASTSRDSLELRDQGWASRRARSVPQEFSPAVGPAPGRITGVPPVASRPSGEGTSESHPPTVEKLATQGDSRTLQLDEQVKKVKVMGPQTLSEHGGRHQRRWSQFDVSGETISAPVPGDCAEV